MNTRFRNANVVTLAQFRDLTKDLPGEMVLFCFEPQEDQEHKGLILSTSVLTENAPKEIQVRMERQAFTGGNFVPANLIEELPSNIPHNALIVEQAPRFDEGSYPE